jgi:hypothetical protein
VIVNLSSIVLLQKAMAAKYSIDEIQFDDSATKRNLPQMDELPVWQYRLWRFKSENTKLERCLPKNQHTH